MIDLIQLIYAPVLGSVSQNCVCKNCPPGELKQQDAVALAWQLSLGLEHVTDAKDPAKAGVEERKTKDNETVADNRLAIMSDLNAARRGDLSSLNGNEDRYRSVRTHRYLKEVTKTVYAPRYYYHLRALAGKYHRRSINIHIVVSETISIGHLYAPCPPC